MTPPDPLVWEERPETVRCTECGSIIDAVIADLHLRLRRCHE